jgi:hypothetical protein
MNIIPKESLDLFIVTFLASHEEDYLVSRE